MREFIHHIASHLPWLPGLAMGLAVGLGLASALPAQTLAFRRFDGRDGLPQSQVRVLLEDRQGFLWVGTHGGVARLGGSGFKSFGIAQGLGIGRVRALLEDREGAIWVAQTDAGLARIQGSPVRSFGAAEGLPDSNCYVLALDASGAVMVGTSSGLLRWDGGAFHFVDLGPLGHEPIYGMVQAAEGLWVSTRKGQVGLWDGLQLKVEHLPAEVAQREVWKLLMDSSKRIWALTRPGLFRREGDHWIAVPLEGTHGVPKLQDFAFDKDGSLMVALGGEGLWMQGPAGAPRVLTDKDGLPEEQINMAYRDRNGTLWVGTNGEGLHAQVLPGLRALRGVAPLELGAVLAMEPLPGGGSLFGTSRGLFRWEEGKGLTARWTVKEGLPDNEIWCIGSDGEGGQWLGSAKGLVRWKDGHARSPRLLGDARVYQILRWRGVNLVGTERGLSEMDASGKVTRTFDMPKEAGINDAYVLLGEADGVLVGCSKGLYRFDGQQLSRVFPQAPFSNTRVVALYRDAGGDLYVGTVKGLFRSTPNGWDYHGAENGLPDAHIYFLGDGGQGRLAIGHGKGMSLLGPDGQLQHLNQGLGLLSDETNQGSVRLDEAGRLWFGMVNGVCILDTKVPLRLPELQVPRVLEVSWSGGRAHLPSRLELPPRTDSVGFEFEQGMPIFSRPPIYEVHMDGLSEQWQRTGEGHSIRYGRLGAGSYAFRVRVSQDGRHWIEGPPVSLRVRPTWFEHPLGRLALLLLALAAVGAFIQWRTLRLRKAAEILEARVEERTRSLDQRNQELKVAHEEVKEILESKVAFTRMVVHDLRSPITSINLLAEVMALEASDRGDAPPPQLEIMAKEAARLEGLLRRLLDQSRSEAVEQTLHMVPSKPSRLLDGMEELLRLKAVGAGLHFEWEAQSVDRKILADSLALQQILLNLSGNALKVTPPGGSVGVRSGVKGESWVLEIWDTGRGFDAGQLDRLFRPFTQVEIGDIGTGWGLGLSIVKSLVDAHGAKISVESKPGRGTTFRIAFALLEKMG